MSSTVKASSNPYGIMKLEDSTFYGASVTHPSRRLDSAAPTRELSHNYNSQQQQQSEQHHQKMEHFVAATMVADSLKCNNALQKSNMLGTDSTIQAEDSLEYCIKFPTPKFRNELDAPESDYVFVYKDACVPIVLLLGWAGCQDRYLMKYSKIYEDRGLITVRYTAPVDTLFWKRNAMVPIAEKILKLILDMNFDSHPLIFHVFSNGGAFLYQHISLAIRKHKTPIQIRGMIFDSAPGDRRMLGLYRAIAVIYGKEKKRYHCLSAILITVSLSLMWLVEETFAAFKSLFVKTEPVQTNPFHDLKNEANVCPQMFLYSKDDVVIPYKDIDKFIKHRQQLGVDVSSICFDNAEHVKIYTKYPTQYIHCVCTFINNCLSVPYKGSTPLSTPTSESYIKKYD